MTKLILLKEAKELEETYIKGIEQSEVLVKVLEEKKQNTTDVQKAVFEQIIADLNEDIKHFKNSLRRLDKNYIVQGILGV